ncbi:argininosuccinate lyase (plasmid) [Streptomyces sp. HUAS TT3]|uniref:argininosuccinate lyase n=1 Tax=Streptomyces sp. HUAS TT3 TaxID=3447510 RepID=UPI003F65CDD4
MSTTAPGPPAAPAPPPAAPAATGAAAGSAGADTGRLRTTLHDEAHRIVYDQYLPDTGPDGLGQELHLISEVDRAHLVMLAERGVVDTARTAALLRTITALRADDFAALRGMPMPRGVYLAYEGRLVELLGERVGGVLHTGRSRNDLNATTVRLKARAPYGELLDGTAALARTLLDRAAAHRGVTMPAYTHGQPAVPITYGHYLAGVATAVLRALDGLLDAGRELDVNPLGAGAVGGTSVAIAPERTAELLGFTATAPNSVDAVASRDFVLRLLAACSVLGVTTARAARDLGWWTSEEFGLLRMADDLVGSSSMMPQKRNPFLLEHVQGRSTAAAGGFTAAVAAMATAGFTNAIAVGGEAVRHLWPGLRSTADAVTLLRLAVGGAEPEPERMAQRAVEGFTTATYLAERLVMDGMPFREAHHLVGETVLGALEQGVSLTEAGRARPEVAALAPTGPEAAASWLDPADVAAACVHGAGPGAASAEAALDRLGAELDRLQAEVTARRERWARAAEQLAATVQGIVESA